MTWLLSQTLGRRRSMRILAFISVLAIVACTESSTPAEIAGGSASAAQMVNQRDDVASIAAVACNGEVVDLSGTVHTKASFRITSSGNIVTSSSSDYNLSGIGSLTGTKYNATQKISERAVATDNTTNTANDVALRLVGQGNVQNSVLTLKTHVVMVDGTMKVSHSDFATRCQ